MAQMNRNVNLEEIDADALFGIDALKNQTILQKIVFFGSVIAGVLLNVLLPLFFSTPRIVCILIFMALLMVGVAVGCNYTEDMTYGKYLYYFFFKPSTPLYYRSTEDAKKIREAAQRKLLIKVIAFVVILSVLIGAVFVAGHIRDKRNLHHRAEEITEVVDE